MSIDLEGAVPPHDRLPELPGNLRRVPRNVVPAPKMQPLSGSA